MSAYHHLGRTTSNSINCRRKMKLSERDVQGSYPAGLSEPGARSAGARVPLTVQRFPQDRCCSSVRTGDRQTISSVSVRRTSPVAEVPLVLWNCCWT
ncbi:unnamed protein product [Leuciscus chuanchicus]